MDGLALLCNLHADGPMSLRRLRESGVRSLAELTRVPEDALASILVATPAHARRLAQEAIQLDARLGEMPLEPERAPLDPTLRETIPPSPIELSIDAALEAAQRDQSPEIRFVDPERLDEATEETAAELEFEIDHFPIGVEAYELQPLVDGHDEPLPFAGTSDPPRERELDPVHGAFDQEPEPLPVLEVESAEPRTTLGALVPELRELASEAEPEAEPEAEARGASPPEALVEPVAPEPEPEPEPRATLPLAATEGTVLKKHELPGLDARLCERLVHEGVRTYRALIDLASLSLARRVDVPLTRLLDLRFAASALLRHRLSMPARSAPRAELSSADRSRADRTSDEPVVALIPARPPRTDDATSIATSVAAATPFPPDPQTVRRVAAREREHVREDPGVAGPFV